MASKNIEKGVLQSNVPLVRIVYKTLGGNNNYSFILCGAELADSSRRRRGWEEEDEEEEEKREGGGGKWWLRRLSAGLFLRFEHAFCRPS